jgi:hypothetical protein
MNVEPSSPKMTESETSVPISAKALYIGLRWPTTTRAEPRASAPNT